MPKRYSRQFRKIVAELICVQNEGTIRTAEKFGVPLKTVENWVALAALMTITHRPVTAQRRDSQPC